LPRHSHLDCRASLIQIVAPQGAALYNKTLCGTLQEDAARRVPSQACSACISSAHTECGIGYALQSTL
jgi:hypothetical protein